MAILGFKNEAVATTEITKVLTTLATFGAATAGIGLEAGAIAAVATQFVTMGVGWVSTKKKKNPYNAREKVYSEATHTMEAEAAEIDLEEEVDKNRREVRREDEFVEAPDYIVQKSNTDYESAEGEFADAFVGGGGY